MAKKKKVPSCVGTLSHFSLGCWQVWDRKLRNACLWILDIFQGHSYLLGHREHASSSHHCRGPVVQSRYDKQCQPEAVAPSRKYSIEVAEMPWPPQDPSSLSGRDLSKGCWRSVFSPLSASLWQERSTKPGSRLLRCCRAVFLPEHFTSAKFRRMAVIWRGKFLPHHWGHSTPGELYSSWIRPGYR